MPRPKKSNPSELATVKIENAFWSLLETEKYSDITVLRVSQEACINRNSFYYHYEDINDLAYKAFLHNVDNEVSNKHITALVSSFSEGKQVPIFDMSILPHSKRIMLCARSDSSYLNRMVKELLQKTWFDAMSIDESLLEEDEKMQVHFIMAGLVSVLGSEEIHSNPLLLARLSQTEIGEAMIMTMRKIAERQVK